MTYQSKTYKIRVGCGNLYVTVSYKDSDFHKIVIHRNSKFHCSLGSREVLAKQATFQIRREPKQLIKDLSDPHPCEKYTIVVKSARMKGGLAGNSCADGIAKLVERLINEKKEEAQTATPSTP